MSPPLSTDIRPGAVLAGKYRIEKVLGQGAMGLVVAARHLRLDEDVAIKFLLPAALENPKTIARFEREARAAAKIRSEHVARVRDVGRLESGAPYMVMEHLEGMDLKQYLATTGPLPVEEAIHYLLQASEALAEAHALGIVHRDLKPANMFRIIRTDGTPSIKILDFGISKLQNADVAMTQTATMMGSPYYMSPEQMTSSRDVDARTDVWALGVILHQLLTGNVPFGGKSIGEVCALVLTGTAPRLSETRDDIPFGLQEALDSALSKDRTNRLSNVAEFAQSLVPFGQNGDVMSADRVSRVLGFIPPRTVRKTGALGANEPDATTSAPAPQSEQTLDGAAHSEREQSLTKWPMGARIGAAIAGLCFISAGVYFTTTSGQSAEKAAPPGEGPIASGQGEKNSPQTTQAVEKVTEPPPIPSTPAEAVSTSATPREIPAPSGKKPAAKIADAPLADSASSSLPEPVDTARPRPLPDPLEHYRDRR